MGISPLVIARQALHRARGEQPGITQSTLTQHGLLKARIMSSGALADGKKLLLICYYWKARSQTFVNYHSKKKQSMLK